LDGDDNQTDDWLYDGDTENPSPAGRRHLTPPKSPFEIGEADDYSDPEENEPVKASHRPLPSDAVDLIIDDQHAAEEAQMHEREKGDPNAHFIRHVYVPGDQVSEAGEDEGSTGLGMSPEQHRHAGIDAERQVEEDDIVRQVEPPKILAALQDVDDNPWM
jgi:hypothetical protein